MADLGLLVIAIGWFLQYQVKSNKLTTNFLILYIIGVILLILDGFVHNFGLSSLLNLATAILAFLVYKNLSKKK
jgi:drug/metabolite transporter (DMT)-like permease